MTPEHIEPVLRALGEGHQELRRDVDRAADKLVDVTVALVQADAALAKRVADLESAIENWSILAGRDPQPKRAGLLSRLFRKG